MKFNIGTKILGSFLAILLLVVIVGFYTLSVNQNALEEAVGQGSVFLVEDTIQRIDKNIFLKLEELEKFKSDILLQSTLKESNEEFEKLEDVDAYILGKDSDWINAPENEITPFMESLISNPLSERLREFFIIFGEQRYGYQTYGEVFVTNKYGALVSATGKTSDYNQADEMWWENTKDGKFSISTFEYDTSAAVWGIPLSVRVDDGEGNFLGLIKALVPAGIIAREAELTNKKYETSEITLLTNSQEVVYKTGAFRFLEDISDEQFFENVDEESGFFVALEGEREKLFSYTNSKGFRNYEGLGWILLLSHDTSEVFAPLRQLRNLLLGVTGVLLLVILILAFIMSRSISVPVKKLTETAQAIASGDLKRHVEVNSKDEIGQLGGAFNVMTSKLKASYEGLEEKVKVRTKELLKSNQLKDLFMDIMRHDLLNPAGVVRTNTQLALMDEKDVKQKEVLETIERNSNRMITMIQNASIIAKLESGGKINFKEEDLGVMLKGSVEELSERAKEKGMKVNVFVDGKFPAVVNPLIQNVFSNFISNAIKYSPEKTEIIVGIKEKGNDWLVYVEDQGEGIPTKYKTAIFERFTRLEKGAIKGSGLGLAISKKIAEAHNGKIWVRDHKGGGSVFYVLIPKVHEVGVKPVVEKIPQKKVVGQVVKKEIVEVPQEVGGEMSRDKIKGDNNGK